MQYRRLGKVGQVSTLGFGCMRLPEIVINGVKTVDEQKSIALLREAYNLGVNYFDTAVFYCDGLSQSVLGKAVKPFRNDIFLATKLPLHDNFKTIDFMKTLEESLSKIDTDYIDVYHFHGINKKMFDTIIRPKQLIGEAQKALDQGLIRHISFSFHGEPGEIAYIIEQGEIFSSILCQYNLLDRSNENAIEKAAEKDIGVVVMGPVGGGRLGGASALSEIISPNSESATPQLALRFVLGNKNVSCALSGMSTLQMLTENAKIASEREPMTEKQFEQAGIMLEEIERMRELYCTGCNYCLPCPAGIDIPAVFKAYNLHNVYGLTETAKQSYENIIKKNDYKPISEQCLECGACIDKCPQNLNIPELLKVCASELAK